MFESFYGLKENPFNLHPDPDYLFMSAGHELAYSHLVYAIAENKGFVIITGEIGSGKTTLLNYLLREIPQDVAVGLINNTDLTPGEFLRTMCREFEVEVDGLDKSAVISRFHDFLLEQFSGKKRVVLIVDEAQNLSSRTIEAIRMISNMESEKSHLIQIVLVGQPELKEKLKQPGLQQFTQRVTVHCHLNGLTQAEVKKYIAYRLRIAGSRRPDLFSESAMAAVASHSRGIPRLINIVCDTALVYGFADAREQIDDKVIEDVMKERSASGIFDLVPEAKGIIEDKSTAASSNGNGHYKEQIALLEKKIDHLESVCGSLNDLVSKLSQKRDEKDTVIVELYKLLKNSMESRYKVLTHISKFHSRKSQAEHQLQNITRKSG